MRNRHAIHAALASAIAAGCGPDLSLYTQPACESGTPSLRGVAPAMPVDSMELRLITDLGGDMLSQQTLFGVGRKCATARDKAACETALANLKPTTGFHSICVDICTRYYVAVTRGDEVLAVATKEAWRAFLGTIDTEQEAALIAFAEGYNLNCSDLAQGGVRKVGTGYEVIGTTGFACGPGTALVRHVVSVSPSGMVQQVSEDVLKRGDANCAVGRRPAGLRRRRSRQGGALARHLADVARLEAASVDAFLMLFRDLRDHGARDALLLQVALAVRDEVRHAEVMSALARAHGAQVEAPVIEKTQSGVRPLFEIARENLVEGCIRETFGAAVAGFQARRAQDPVLRAVLADIHKEESDHAALSFDVAEFCEERLSIKERNELAQVRIAAIRQLRQELSVEPEPEVRERAGMPTSAEALAMADALGFAL